MSKTPPRRVYREGHVVQRTDGIPWVKTSEGWKAEHRRIMELREGELQPGWKVFHLDNNLRDDPKAFNDPKNLTIIKCRTTKWVKFKRTRVLYEPPIKKADKYKQFVPAKAATKS